MISEDEITVLMHDPLIVNMAKALLMFTPMRDQVRKWPTTTGSDSGEVVIPWQFMLRANQEYHKHGGTQAKTIGGPAKAVVALVRA